MWRGRALGVRHWRRTQIDTHPRVRSVLDRRRACAVIFLWRWKFFSDSGDRNYLEIISRFEIDLKSEGLLDENPKQASQVQHLVY